MNLIVEIGNSTSKWAIYDQDKRIYYVKYHHSEEIDVTFLSKFNIKRCMISGSGDPSKFLNYIQQYDPILFDKSMIDSLTYDYKTIDSLGADRILNCYAAQKIFPNANNLIIDIGTCLTCSMIDNTNTFLGGSISPGIHLRVQSLHNFTYRLPLVKLESAFNENIGKSTEESIKSGIYIGILSEINLRIKTYLDNYPQLNIILTGGDALLFENRIKNKIFALPEMSLWGMNHLLTHYT